MLWKEDLGINVFEDGLVNALNSEKYLRMVRPLLGIEQSYEQMRNIPCLHCQHCGHCGEDIRKRNYLYL